MQKQEIKALLDKTIREAHAQNESLDNLPFDNPTTGELCRARWMRYYRKSAMQLRVLLQTRA